MKMKLLSVNVGRPTEYQYRGETVRSAIFKNPAGGPVGVGETGLDGDRQANSEVHGGEHKAVYAYSHDHYDWWRKELGRDDLSFGQFGENLTIAGLDDARIRIGDRLRIGTAEFSVTGPRIPCAKLGMKFDDMSLPQRFTDALRPGFYLKVLETGVVQAGDAVEHEHTAEGSLSISALFRAYTRPRSEGARAALERALTLPGLDPAFVPNIHKRLEALDDTR